MKKNKLIILLPFLLFLIGCSNTQHSHVAEVTIKINSQANHPFLIEKITLEPPQHIGTHPMGHTNTNIHITNEQQEATIIFEQKLPYNIKVYQTSLDFEGQPEQSQYDDYKEELVVDIEKTFEEGGKVYIIDVPD